MDADEMAPELGDTVTVETLWYGQPAEAEAEVLKVFKNGTIRVRFSDNGAIQNVAPEKCSVLRRAG